jgi:dTDP-4-amino-4,6-dideoxygalactose transaminase
MFAKPFNLQTKLSYMIPFSPPYIDQNTIDEVTDTLRSGWITTGPKVKELENVLAAIINKPNVLCVNSWTSGAIMILRWLGLKDGDEVIIPAYTYSATALAVIHAGGVPVMVDVGDDFNLDVNKVEQAINHKTKAIIPVDFAGLPCDYDTLFKIIAKDKIKSIFNPSSDIQKKLGRILILSDAAHSLGAKYKGESTGFHADITIFSLHAVKNITTAEGGAIVINMPSPFNNNELYSELRLMTSNCQTKDAFKKSKAGSWRYDIVGLGMKINMADVNAAIGLSQIRVYNELLIKRERVFERYSEGFSQFKWAKLPILKDENRKSSCHIYPVRITGILENERDEIINEIVKSEIAVNVHFIPLPLLTFFKSLGYQIENYPVSHSNYATEISLPIYPQLEDIQVDYIIESVINAYMIVMKKFKNMETS